MVVSRLVGMFRRTDGKPSAGQRGLELGFIVAGSAAHGIRASACGYLVDLRSEPVADAEVRVDVVPARRRRTQLLPELADEHVDRAVAVRHRVTPDPLVDLLAAQHAIRLREQVQDLELARGQLEARLAGVRLVEVGTDRDLADVVASSICGISLRR